MVMSKANPGVALVTAASSGIGYEQLTRMLPPPRTTPMHRHICTEAASVIGERLALTDAVLIQIADVQAEHTASLTRIEGRLDGIEATLAAAILARLLP
jgi:hypothetical protein